MTPTFWVAMTALVILGVGDMISVFVRSLLVPLNTPDEIRGRGAARAGHGVVGTRIVSIALAHADVRGN
jgi:hypothetical protein